MGSGVVAGGSRIGVLHVAVDYLRVRAIPAGGGSVVMGAGISQRTGCVHRQGTGPSAPSTPCPNPGRQLLAGNKAASPADSFPPAAGDAPRLPGRGKKPWTKPPNVLTRPSGDEPRSRRVVICVL